MNQKNTTEAFLEFLSPVIMENIDEKEFLLIAQFGQLAWNFSVASINRMPQQEEYADQIISLIDKNDTVARVISYLTERKRIKFPEFKTFIKNFFISHDVNGRRILHTESVPIETFQKF